MIDQQPILVIRLAGGYTPAGRPRQINMIVNAQGFALAYSDHDPSSNLADVLTPNAQVVTISATAGEIRERKQMARASGRMMAVDTTPVADRFAQALVNAEIVGAQRFAPVAIA